MTNAKAFPRGVDELTQTYFSCLDKLLLPTTSRNMARFYLRLMFYCSRKLSAGRDLN